MRVLGLETAGAVCAVCVGDGGRVAALRCETMARGQDARIIPLAQEALAEAGFALGAMDRFVALRGPGSFTGIRVGLAAARGCAWSVGRPVLGVDRREVYRAQTAALSGPVAVVLESKRHEAFVAFLGLAAGPGAGADPEAWRLVAPEAWADIINAEAGVSWRIVGDGAVRLRGLVPEAFLIPEPPEPEVVTASTLAAALAAGDDPAFAPSPLYVRPPDVTLRKTGCA